MNCGSESGKRDTCHLCEDLFLSNSLIYDDEMATYLCKECFETINSKEEQCDECKDYFDAEEMNDVSDISDIPYNSICCECNEGWEDICMKEKTEAMDRLGQGRIW